MNPQDATPGSPHPALNRALKRLLRPLVRLLIRQGVTFPYLATLLKEVYDASARDDFAPADVRQTDSRITLLTGVHRKDVKRFRDLEEQGVDVPPATLSLSAQIIALWTGDPRYRALTGEPLPLPRSAANGVSFEALVNRVSKDIRPRAVLDDWIARGMAHLDDHERVVLARAAFVPREDIEEFAFYLGRNVHDHLAACDHNLEASGQPLIERAVYYDRLSQASLARLEELSREAGMELLLRLNSEAHALAERDAAGDDHDGRMSFGVYFYRDPEPGAGDD